MVLISEEGFGNDNIQGTSGSDLIFATTLGIGNSIINTGTGGFDVVIGNNTQIIGNGIGILASNISGEDSDNLTVVGHGTSIGMVLTTISGGAGGDNIKATGSSTGVIGVDIDGGGGNDTFDLQNGTGTVDGGSGMGDLLILDGAVSEYTFTETGPNQSGNIVGDTNGTNLVVKDIEQFILNGQQFTFEELFVGSSPIEVSIADLSQEEGDFGNTSFVFNLTRTGDLSNSLTVQWDLELDGQADEDDFALNQAPNGQVVFSAGSANAEVLIQVNGDTDFEPDETFTVRLSNPSAGTLDKDTATGTILNDDEPPLPELPELSIEATDANKEEGNDGPNPFTFTVTRTGDDLSEETTVTWTATPSFTNPVDANDFVAGTIFTDELTFQPGDTSLDITLNVNGDLDFEEDEGFTVTLSDPSNGTLGQGIATGTILNDDDEPTPPEQGEIIRRKQIVGQTVEGTDLSDSYEATQGGINTSTFETLGGNDSVRSVLTDSSSQISAIILSEINTGDGDDTVTAETEFGGGAAGINRSIINTGADNDTISVISPGYGLDTVTINAGSGNDRISIEGQNFALRDSFIYGEDGNDTIELINDDIRNGVNSTINGGSGDQDRLILSGTTDQFKFTPDSGTKLKGTIFDDQSNGQTSLNVEDVERFTFDDGDFTFDELFGSTSSALGDFVWDDLNGNGIQDEGEPGIAGVSVTLLDNTNDTTIGTVSTDENGLYLFENLLVGPRYQVTFSIPDGFEPTDFQAGANPEIDSDAIAFPSAGIAISPGVLLDSSQDTLGIDAGFVAVI